VINEPVHAFDRADARSVVDLLWSSWPVLATMRPADVGMEGSAHRAVDFVNTIQELSDSGLIIYEAFVVGPGGPRVLEVALTARGRAMLGSWLNAHPGQARQLAS
jgi:hypothetical protein